MNDIQLKFALPIGSIEAYIQRAQQIPLLSLEEEYALGISLQEKGDLQAAQTLVVAHLRYVVTIAKNYLGYGLHLADLIQEGTLGLMKAVKRFDPNKGVRLAAFAVHWIKAEIHEFIIKNWRIVKIATTKAQRKLFFNLRSYTSSNAEAYLELQQIAKDLGVTPKDVVHMQQRLSAQDLPLDPLNKEGSVAIPAQALIAANSDPGQSLLETEYAEKTQQKLALALQTLNPREQDIINARWLAVEKIPLKDLAVKYNISVERIRQLEVQAINRLKGFIEKE